MVRSLSLAFAIAPNPNLSASHCQEDRIRLGTWPKLLHVKSHSSTSCSWSGAVEHDTRRFLSISSATGRFSVRASLSSSPSSSSSPKTKLYVSGLSFRTTEESLRNAFQKFGQLVEVNLVMDKIANRPRGFAFLRYATEEESQKAIEGMHGKFLDGRVIFVEVSKPRSELRQGFKQNPRPY